MFRETTSAVSAITPTLEYKLSNANLVAANSFQSVELEFHGIMNDPEALKALWKQLDSNGNGIVSLSEVTNLITDKFPAVNHKPATIRAFQQTTLRDGSGILCIVCYFILDN